jgi:hypothetical protein
MELLPVAFLDKVFLAFSKILEVVSHYLEECGTEK